jgi:hypothetical protein
MEDCLTKERRRRATSPIPDTCVIWIVPMAWESGGHVVPQHVPIPLHKWLAILRDEGMTVEPLPNGHIVGGLCAGGQVVRTQCAGEAHLFALPSIALPVLEEMLSSSVMTPSVSCHQRWKGRPHEVAGGERDE